MVAGGIQVGRDPHGAAGRGELEGVADEVEDHAAQALRVGVNRGEVWAGLQGEGDFLAAGEFAQRRDAGFDELGRAHRPGLDQRVTGLQLGDIEKVVDHLQQLRAAAAGDADEFPRFLRQVRIFLHSVEAADHRGEGLTEVVDESASEHVLLAIEVFELSVLVEQDADHEEGDRSGGESLYR